MHRTPFGPDTLHVNMNLLIGEWFQLRHHVHEYITEGPRAEFVYNQRVVANRIILRSPLGKDRYVVVLVRNTHSNQKQTCDGCNALRVS